MRWLRISTYIGTLVTTAFYLGMTIAQFVFVTPRRGETFFSHQETRYQHLALVVGVPSAAVGLCIDLYILVLPIIAVSQLQLTTQRKIGVILVFLTGIMYDRRAPSPQVRHAQCDRACLSSALSIYYRHVLGQSTDVIWNLMPVFTVGQVFLYSSNHHELATNHLKVWLRCLSVSFVLACRRPLTCVAKRFLLTIPWKLNGILDPSHLNSVWKRTTIRCQTPKYHFTANRMGPISVPVAPRIQKVRTQRSLRPYRPSSELVSSVMWKETVFMWIITCQRVGSRIRYRSRRSYLGRWRLSSVKWVQQLRRLQGDVIGLSKIYIRYVDSAGWEVRSDLDDSCRRALERTK